MLLRFAWAMVTAPFRQKLEPFHDSVIRFRVLPNDIDINLHLNNGRYLSIMDLGRLDLIARNGMLRVVMKEKWLPLVGSASIRFLKSVDPFKTYELRTRVLCWDEKWFYIEHYVERRGEVLAVAWIQGLFRSRTGNVRPRDMLAKAGLPVESPLMPPPVAAWQAAIRANEPGPKNTALASE